MRIEEEATSPDRPIGPCRRPLRVSCGSPLVPVVGIPITHPLMDVTRQIQDPEHARPSWTRTGWVGVAMVAFEGVRELAGRRDIAPRVDAAVCAASRLLPLRLGRKSLSDEPAVRRSP